MSCNQFSDEKVRMCDGNTVTSSKIEGTDTLDQPMKVIVIFRSDLKSYCWGQIFSDKKVFYLPPEDFAPMQSLINGRKCISFDFVQASTFRIKDVAWFHQ